ncbi:MAG: DUF6273 domain-containing protein [Anaerotardibacter sp.]
MQNLALRTCLLGDALVIADEFELGTWEERPIVWRILSIEGTKLLAITVDALTTRAFHADAQGSTWENSDVRAWLNGEFLQTAFSEEIQAALQKRTILNKGNASFEGADAPDTCDTVFLLSIEELESLMPFKATRTIDGSKGTWWLRTSGYSKEFCATVQQDGWINEYGYQVDQDFIALRPVIEIELSADMLLFPEDVAEKPSLEFDADAEDVLEITYGEAPDHAGYLTTYPLTTASAYGEELMLEVLEEEDLSLAIDFLQWFGVDQSWESCLSDELCRVAKEGNVQAIDVLYDVSGGIENAGRALALALACGNQSAARLLLRKGASLKGTGKKAPLVNDTPGLAKERRSHYLEENGNLFAEVLKGDKARICIKELISQGVLKGEDLRGILYEAARNEEHRSLFAWIMNPDNNPIPGLGARWVKKHLVVAKKSPKSDVAVSAEGLRLFWHPELLQEDPETVRVIAPYLSDPNMEGKRELICFMAKKGWTVELKQLLQGRKVFTPKMIAAAFEESRKARNRETTAFLADFLRSIGAGKLLEKQDEN